MLAADDFQRADCFRRFFAVHFWHRDVHENQIRAKTFIELYCFKTVGRESEVDVQ